MSDNQPRYTTKRLHDEIAKAKAYARREALEEAAKVAESRHTYRRVSLTWDENGDPIETPAGVAGPGADIAYAIRTMKDGGAE